MRARAGLGVELDGACAQVGEVEALDRAVVERHVRRLVALGRLDREAVVLARDEHPSGFALEHRMVRAAVAEWQLVRAVTRREAEQLVPEADPEDGHASEEVAHDLRLGLQRLGVAGPVREDDAVEPGELVGGRRMRDTRSRRLPRRRAAA